MGAALPGEIYKATVLASAARTATIASEDFENESYKGMILTIECSAIAATPSVVFTVQGKDHAGNYYTLLASTAVTTASTNQQLMIHPALTVAANVAASKLLPKIWRVNAVHGDADSITYSVGVEMIP